MVPQLVQGAFYVDVGLNVGMDVELLLVFQLKPLWTRGWTSCRLAGWFREWQFG
jgi:hypothetical protein